MSMTQPAQFAPLAPLAPLNERGVFCNRTLNMRSIRAIGYDMDYTLVHYHIEVWERRAYDYLKKYFLDQGWPVEDLQFESRRVARGLIIDVELGNLLKANRFGFIKRSMHGTRLVEFDEQRRLYARTVVDLSEKRWIFLNTFFSLSECCMYLQLVDLLDARKIPEILGYKDLYDRVRRVLDSAHMEGRLKSDIIDHPDRYVLLDPETPLTLLDQHTSGKKLMLITNSEWLYTVSMMSYAFDRFLPKGMTWRGLFDVVIVSARKPSFFTMNNPFFEVVTTDGLLRPSIGGLKPGMAYLGGSTVELERHLGVSGDQILYVGDHMFGDVHVTKNVLRWRTALILRELEEEIRAVALFRDPERRLTTMMDLKERLETEVNQAKVRVQRQQAGYGPPLTEDLKESRHGDPQERLQALDLEIAPLARESQELLNPTWGLLMHTGNDKSLLAYQMERYADIYTSRVSNLLLATPFAYFRSPRSTLPHDPV